jgi:hypothetical protein
MPEPLPAYYAEVRAFEDEYFNLYYRKSRLLGSSVRWRTSTGFGKSTPGSAKTPSAVGG